LIALSQIFFKNQKCLAKNKTFLFQRFSLKMSFSVPAFDDNLSLTHVFIKQIFRAVEVAPPFPLPPQGCAGSGVVGVLFSHKFWLWLWL
jgi:hypothetical protein